ncbi:YopX family protein [Lysinibacillus irui]|uniref:YopX family protein n=1 Tax=Lysinibacillus irui TaxID=2998077 RepID=UPI0038853DB1
MKENTGVNDLNGKAILEGDILVDNLPSKGIVVRLEDGQYAVTSDFQGRDIRQIENSDLLNTYLIKDHEMTSIGNIHDNPNILY